MEGLLKREYAPLVK